MSHDPHAQFDQTTLEMIEHSPVGAVPFTPTYQDSLKRLYASHQVYASADFKGGHVTVRSLAKLPLFHAANFDALVAGAIKADDLEANPAIFDRYLAALPAALRAKAETHRLKVVGRPVHHRKHTGTGPEIHDPVHSLILVPGTGPHPGLPGNYLYGSLFETAPVAGGAGSHWAIQLHDTDDGASTYDAASLPEVLEKLQEVFASAPFHLSELTALGFKSN
jgi:hypothetical protein